MSKTQELAERVERLLLRHEELKRTHDLLAQQLTTVTQERDNLRSRLNAARARIDSLLQRLPAGNPADAPADRERKRDLSELRNHFGPCCKVVVLRPFSWAFCNASAASGGM